MHNLFFYQREITTKVPLVNQEEGDQIKDPGVEVVETYWDCFNISKVVRGHWTSKDEFTILLDDGHEQADFSEKPIFQKGKLVRVDRVKERAWFASQIPLKREDAERLMKAMGMSL
jgi:hypothetical protein